MEEPKIKYPFQDDYAVQVWREERQAALPENAHFYKGIFDVTVLELADLMFVPAFPRTPDNWPATVPNNVDIVHSEYEARLYTAALANMAVTPDEKLAGQVQFFPFPPPPPGYSPSRSSPTMGVLFFVTPEQYELFSEELLTIEKDTFFTNQYVRLAKVKHFECIKFILEVIVPFQRQREASNGHQATNGFMMHLEAKAAATTNGVVTLELVAA
jgi:hypothetical protein